MRITERRLRQVIRQVIRESMHDDIDTNKQCINNFNNSIDMLCNMDFVYLKIYKLTKQTTT